MPGNSFEELDDLIKSKIIGNTGIGFQCADCNYATQSKRNMFNHIESRHVTSAGVECWACAKVCPTREALRKHMSRDHKQHE